MILKYKVKVKKGTPDGNPGTFKDGKIKIHVKASNDIIKVIEKEFRNILNKLNKE